jgi:hypothetical protein
MNDAMPVRDLNETAPAFLPIKPFAFQRRWH